MAETGRLTQVPFNKGGIQLCGLNRPLIKYSTSIVQMDECDWLARLQ